MGMMASHITSLTIAYSTVYSGIDQRKHQSSASLAFVWGIHRWPMNSPHKWLVIRKMFPFDHVIMMANSVPSQWYRIEEPSRSSMLIHNRHQFLSGWPVWPCLLPTIATSPPRGRPDSKCLWILTMLMWVTHWKGNVVCLMAISSFWQNFSSIFLVVLEVVFDKFYYRQWWKFYQNEDFPLLLPTHCYVRSSKMQ